jgi:hypothetical protein
MNDILDKQEDAIEETFRLLRQAHTEKYVFPKVEGEVHPGMELRDYFAAKVLAVACKKYGEWESARMAYAYADAMLEIRNKG